MGFLIYSFIDSCFECFCLLSVFREKEILKWDQVDDVRDPVEAVGALFGKVNKEELLVLYRIAEFKDYKGFLMNIAESRVKYKKGGILDLEGAAKLVLHDWATGKIKYYVTPPNYGTKGIEEEN